ncbi:type II toxin-antitoxin system Phd/YefM family antitoxin [Nostoc sp. CMAA1605]|uniref:type II toxin-antitoxin system Phd/YefM family antitoxin n=1 Tax=Nostoc sp. CMAA1605 TaxID=2055159 RepID=UPI001F26219E|nr:type II toxin-antitoxin system Phd/YefM family antitoxin [Nostoc sp. CMAA1605]MCF4969214.1 prevent-host-death protein [Nostoc sp. CMAA1605]
MSIESPIAEAAKNLENICSNVIENSEVVKISRPDGNNVVLIAETELQSLLETLYLLRFPANSARLFTALQRAKLKTVMPQSVSELYARFELNEDENSSNIDMAS